MAVSTIIITRDNGSKIADPVPDQSVTISNGTDEFTEKTNVNGEAIFNDIPASVYDVTTIDQGIPYCTTVDCTSGEGTAYIRFPMITS